MAALVPQPAVEVLAAAAAAAEAAEVLHLMASLAAAVPLAETEAASLAEAFVALHLQVAASCRSLSLVQLARWVLHLQWRSLAAVSCSPVGPIQEGQGVLWLDQQQA